MPKRWPNSNSGWAKRIPGWMNDEDIEALAELAEGAKSWTEVGSFCGRSFLAVGYSLPDGAMIQAVDRELGYRTVAGQSMLTTYQELSLNRPDLEIVLCKADSVSGSRLVADSDVVFIDTEHGYQEVRRDIKAWRRKCRILCGHDYQKRYPGLMKAVDELCPNREIKGFSIWVSPV